VAQDKGGAIDFTSGTDAIKELPLYNISHSISATGKRAYGPTSSSNNAPKGLIRDAWENAKIWVENRVGVDIKAADADPKDYVTKEELLGTTTSPRAVNKDREYDGVLQTLDWGGILSSEADSIDIAHYAAFNVVRTQQVNVYSGTYSITESFLYANKTTFPHDVTEDVSVDLSYDLASGLSTVTLNATITGFRETSDGGAENYDTTANSKFTNANTRYGSWSDSNANTLAKALSGNTSLNGKPTSKTVAKNEIAGTVSLAYVFNDRPNNLALSDVPVSQTLTITDNGQADAFATIAVPGRASGPVLQNLGTKTGPSSRTVACSVVMGPDYTGTGLQVAGNVYSEIYDYKPQYSSVYKTADTQTYDPWAKSYSRSVTWQYQSC